MSSIEEALAENQKTPASRKISLYCRWKVEYSSTKNAGFTWNNLHQIA